jgi:hypothetical protein
MMKTVEDLVDEAGTISYSKKIAGAKQSDYAKGGKLESKSASESVGVKRKGGADTKTSVAAVKSEKRKKAKVTADDNEKTAGSRIKSGGYNKECLLNLELSRLLDCPSNISRPAV